MKLAARGHLGELADRVRDGSFPVIELGEAIYEDRAVFSNITDLDEFLGLAKREGAERLYLYEEIQREFPHQGETSMIEVCFRLDRGFLGFLATAEWILAEEGLSRPEARDLTIRVGR
jgi:hypothetical protein